MVRKGSSVRVRFRASNCDDDLPRMEPVTMAAEFWPKVSVGSPLSGGEKMVSIESGTFLRAALLLVGALAALAALAPAAFAAPSNDSFSAAETLPAGLPASGSGTTLEAT